MVHPGFAAVVAVGVAKIMAGLGVGGVPPAPGEMQAALVEDGR
jgi:hypothetical protein